MDKKYYDDDYGNKYTDHAVTGMQPSGHRFSDGGVIHYTDARGVDCDGSSIPAMVVDDVIKNGTSEKDERDGKECTTYTLNGVKVVTNSDGAVVTTTKIKKD